MSIESVGYDSQMLDGKCVFGITTILESSKQEPALKRLCLLC